MQAPRFPEGPEWTLCDPSSQAKNAEETRFGDPSGCLPEAEAGFSYFARRGSWVVFRSGVPVDDIVTSPVTRGCLNDLKTNDMS